MALQQQHKEGQAGKAAHSRDECHRAPSPEPTADRLLCSTRPAWGACCAGMFGCTTCLVEGKSSSSSSATPTHLVVVDELVHAPGPQGRAHRVCQSHARIDVAHKLGRALAGVCALFQQDDLRLLRTAANVIHSGCCSMQGRPLGAAGQPVFHQAHHAHHWHHLGSLLRLEELNLLCLMDVIYRLLWAPIRGSWGDS
jgi:hypothetical protein